MDDMDGMEMEGEQTDVNQTPDEGQENYDYQDFPN